MLIKILESTLGPMTNDQFQQVLDFATADIIVNSVAFGKRTSLADAVGIVGICKAVLGRG